MTHKKNILLFLMILVMPLLLNADLLKQLDARRFEAWTIEYEPYRLLVENAVIEYASITGDDIPEIYPGDILIAIRSKSRKNQVYQLRYGSHVSGFNVIESEMVNWVLGSTLMMTIAEKDQYYHLDTTAPFQDTQIKPELDYLNKELFWTNSSLLIGLSRSIYRLSNSSGLLFEWGNELMGLPHADAGTMRIGVATPVFKLGMQMPSLIDIGIRPGAEDWERLNGGIGGFGAFNYSNFYGELNFLTNTADVLSSDPSINKTTDSLISYMDVSGLAYVNFGAPMKKMKGAFQIKPGFAFYRIANRKIVDVDGEKRLIYRNKNRENEHFNNANEVGFGFFLRMDYSSALAHNIYPKFLFSMQLNSATSFLSKFTLNINESIALPITFVYYLDGENKDYFPRFATHFGIQFRLDKF